MNTIERLNEVIEYMESHISEDICMDTLAHLYGTSLSVLQKTFLNICEITLSEYLRRRRLSNAIFDLRTGDKILDIALKYQYQSGDAFSRAFKQQLRIQIIAGNDFKNTKKTLSRNTFYS